MKTKFTTTQFLVVLLINALFLFTLGLHYFSETVRTVTVTKDVPVIKYQKQIVKDCTTVKTVTKTVQSCDSVNSYNSMMNTASQVCQHNGNGDYSNLSSFSVDNNNRPVFKCD